MLRYYLKKEKNSIDFHQSKGQPTADGLFPIFGIMMSQSETVRVRDLSQLNATPVYYIIPAFTLRFGIQCVIPVHKSKQEEISLNTSWVMFNVKCTTVIYGGNLSGSLSTGKISFR